MIVKKYTILEVADSLDEFEIMESWSDRFIIMKITPGDIVEIGKIKKMFDDKYGAK